MSETVHFKGTMTEIIKLDNETLENQCKRILEEKPSFEALEDYYDSHVEKLLDAYYQEYAIYEDILFSVVKYSIENDGEIFRIERNGNGTLNFEVRYYNGGCSFSEAIDYAFEDKKKEDKRLFEQQQPYRKSMEEWGRYK